MKKKKTYLSELEQLQCTSETLPFQRNDRSYRTFLDILACTRHFTRRKSSSSARDKSDTSTETKDFFPRLSTVGEHLNSVKSSGTGTLGYLLNSPRYTARFVSNCRGLTPACTNIFVNFFFFFLFFLAKTDAKKNFFIGHNFHKEILYLPP